MDNKHRKLLVVKQYQKGADFCVKCTTIRLAADLCPDTTAELMAPPDRLAAMGAYL